MRRDARNAVFVNDAQYASVLGIPGILRDARDVVYAKDAEHVKMSGVLGMQGYLGMPRMMPRM